MMSMPAAIPVMLLLAFAAAQTTPPSPSASQRKTDATTISLPRGVTREAYYQQLRTQRPGKAPWRWRLVTGRLPAGLELRSDGLIYGTPTAGGDYRFRWLASDSS